MIYDFSVVEPSAFAALCVQLLKLEVSPNVRQGPVMGPDGGRDALLQGPCVTGRYDWTGNWTFQFKHRIARDRPPSPATVLRVFQKEVTSLLDRRPDVQNYVLLFSHPQTVGLLNGLESLRDQLSATRGVNFDFWDGTELSHLLQRHNEVRKTYFPRIWDAFAPGTVESPLNSSLMPLPWAGLGGVQTLEDAAAVLCYLVGGEVPILSPGNLSPLTQTFFLGGPRALTSLTDPYLKEFVPYASALEADKGTAFTYGGLLMFDMLGKVRLNTNLSAQCGRARHFIRTFGSRYPELNVYGHDILATALGKLNDPHFPAVSATASRLAQEAGLIWLRATIEFRQVHKESWRVGELGLADTAQGEDQFRLIADAPSSVSSTEREHLTGILHAMLGLHLRWNERTKGLALDHVRLAQQSLSQVGDISERTRVDVEAALLGRVRGVPRERIIAELRQAISNRLRIGDLSRLRYDLHWLGDLYSDEGLDQWASACQYQALRLHHKLFGQSRADHELAAAILSRLSRLPQPDARTSLGLLSNATGLASVLWRPLDVASGQGDGP